MGTAEVRRDPARSGSVLAPQDEGLPLRLQDVVITSGASLALTFLAVSCRWVPGWKESAAVFGVIAAGPPVLRALARRFPRRRVLEWAASFWLIPSASVGHGHLGPLVDGVRPVLLDRYLALADLRVFGELPAVVLDRHLRGPVMDVLMCCYYTYFLWPVLLGVVLYRRSPRLFDRFVLALALLFSLNFLLYALVPAVGPRYFLPGAFDGALHGSAITATLDSLMRQPAFARDCFPSGHTAGTLLVLGYAWRHARRFFWGMLGPALGLITATLAGRFHYGVDLIAAVPLVLTVVSAASMLTRARPEGVVVPDPVIAYRESMRA